MKRTSLLSILVVAVAIDAAESSLTAAQLPAEGLVAAWAFDETGGDQVKDSSGRSHHGVLRGATRAAGKSGGAIECRKDALVEVPHGRTLDDFKDGMTVSAWVNRAADTNWNTVISREIKDGWSEYFGLAVVKNKALFSVDGDGAHYKNIKSEEDMPVGEWVHLAGTYDNREFKLYVNGRLAKSAPYTIPFTFADTNPLLIGGNSNSQGKSWLDCFHGRLDEVRLYARALAASEVAVLASAKPNSAAPFIRAETKKVSDDFRSLTAITKENLARDIAALAPGGQLKADDKNLATFIQDLVQSLSATELSDGNAAILAGNLEEVLNSGQGSVRQTQGAVRNFAHTLKLAEVDHAQADKVGADLTVLAKVPTDPGPFDGPRHPFRFALSEAPRYDKAVLVEDFESGTDIFKTWYQPYWSTGIVATFDSQHKSGGNRGLTISNTGPTTKRSSMAKFPRPHQDLAGCNALRLWFKPYGLKDSEGTVSMGFIDGSSEIWQVDLPEVLSGTGPCVIQVRLADFRRVLRRNNGRIDLENRDFCFWMTGTYKFTVDDILFVHDPAIPDFESAAAFAVPTK